jgi:excisionase family DNA binding protein
MQNHETPKLAYSISEACAAISIKRSKLYEMIGQGRIETRKIGSRTIIPAESLRALVAGDQGKV